MSGLFNFFRTKARRGTVRDAAPRRQITRVLAIVACALGMSAAIPANAACSFVSGGSFNTGNVNMGSITVPPNVPVGTVLASKQVSFNSVVGQQSFTCGNNLVTTVSFAMSGSGTSGIYPTNIPGIGIRIYAWTSQGYYGAPTTPTLTPNSWTFSFSVSGAYGTGYQQLRFDLVATGPVSNSGTNTLSYNVAPWFSVAANDGSGQMALANLALTATVTTPTCSVTNTVVPVLLPTVSTGSLNTGPAGTTSFSLDLNCTAGIKVGVTLTDATNPSNTSTTLSLSPDSIATGVGVQILKGSMPIAYGADSPAADNLNQWSAGTALGGPMSIPLTARYVRTTGTLNAGPVKALATFTMSYQ